MKRSMQLLLIITLVLLKLNDDIDITAPHADLAAGSIVRK